ncbi:hypothetical protein FG386_002836 [Cryptosporidium ryanae]|uniref:uncharacterized protein n=1 Tax=Cryptosporidium ryanae TaxID=515981 RepID=UPI003519FFBE|nr:hypothetical protein FG386_002836 [Cryptosporidium ryanae]
MDNTTYSVEDIIMSLYGMEVLLKRIKDKQIRECLYDWKYKSLVNKELNNQKKKYNKYMLDGFYALTRQTQSICMLFNLLIMSDHKLKNYAFKRLLINARNSVINESNFVSTDDSIIQEFQHGVMRIINYFSSLSFIISKKNFKTLYCAFYVMLNHKKKVNMIINDENINKLNISNKGIMFCKTEYKVDNSKCDHIIKNNSIMDENKYNTKLGLNRGLFINKNDIYTHNDDNIKLYNRKQNTSFSNGYYIHVPIDRQKAKFDYYNDQIRTGYESKVNSNNNYYYYYCNNNATELSPLNPVFYNSIKSQVNNYDYSVQKQQSNNSIGLFNTNFTNPVLNRRLSPNNSNTNSFQTSNSGISTAAPSPLNTTKYSGNNLYYSVDCNKNEQSDYSFKKSSIYKKKTPKSTQTKSKNFINPCINFTQDSSLMLNNITDTFRSVIMN